MCKEGEYEKEAPTKTTNRECNPTKTIKWVNLRNSKIVGKTGLQGPSKSLSWGQSGAVLEDNIVEEDLKDNNAIIGIEWRVTAGGEELIYFGTPTTDRRKLIFEKGYHRFYIYKHFGENMYYGEPNVDNDDFGVDFSKNHIWGLRVNARGKIEYILDGNVFKTSSAKVKFPLQVSCELLHDGAEITDVKACFANQKCAGA